MNRYSVQSNNIVSVGYDEINQTLEIEFKLHIIHHYIEVPLNEFIAFMKASHIEEFYFNYIQFQYHVEII